MLPTKITLPKLRIFTPKKMGSSEDKVLARHAALGSEVTYYAEPCYDDYGISHFNQFPVLLNSNNAIWRHGTLYLLSKLESIKCPSAKTLESISGDLTNFKRYIDDNEIDYLKSPKRKMRRPTYRYRAYLQDLIVSGEISPNTASRRMSSAIGFYRWLERQHDVDFVYPLWSDKEVYIYFNDDKGFSQAKQIRSTDLSVSIPKSREDYTECIQDGGKLRPLPREEQECLINALKAVGNPEMTLAFLIALTTGARIQTVFTIRLKHVMHDQTNTLNELPLLVGMGTSVDTKFQKQMTIFIPEWLQTRIKVYALSERAARRRKRSIHQFSSVEDQYLFLTQSGAPYYIAEHDPMISAYRYPPRGNSVRQFINTQLMPEIEKTGLVFTFRFHDLRATYGINILESRLARVVDGNGKLFDILMFIKERMGHSNIRTTERYLNYREKLNLALNVQSNFEHYLQNLVESEVWNE